VNAYDDPVETIRARVDALGLGHPILMTGSDVARERYFVSAFPTSLWIDHRGRVVERRVGFLDEDFPDLEQKLRGLLEARSAEARSADDR